MASRTVELRLRVRYEYEGRNDVVPDERQCQGLLEDLVAFAANHGLLSGDTDLIVEDYRFEVQTVGID